MVDFSDKCVVLKVSDYRDNDKLAKVLTAEHGLVTVKLTGVKKAKAKLKAFAQEFSVFDTRLTGKGAFLTPIEPLLIRDGFSLCTDLKIFTAASVAAEAAVSSIGDDEPHTELFLEFLKLISNLVNPDYDPYYQAAVFMLRLMETSGFFKLYNYSEDPKTPIQMLGYAQKMGYGKAPDDDLSRRALKYICSEFERNFDTGLKSVASIDLYGK